MSTAPTPILPLPTALGESRYAWHGKPMVGITRLLQETGFSPDYGAVSHEVMEAARDRGNIVHKATEIYDLTGSMPEVSPELIPFCTAYADFVREQQMGEPHLIESPAVDPLRGFCATVDRVTHFKSRPEAAINPALGLWHPYVLEVKTYAPGEEIWLQLAGQSAAVKATYGLSDFPQCAYVQLKPDGRYRFAVANRADFHRYLAVVTAAATVYGWRRR